MTKILFVCYGNICRSPMAEFVMKDLVDRAGLSRQFQIASAAVSDEEHGNPVYPPARAKLAEHGIGCAGKTARQLRRGDYAKYDYLLAAERSNLPGMLQILGGDPEGKVRRLLDFSTAPRDIADPWFTRDFDRTWTDVLEGCQSLLAHIQSAEA